MSIILLFLEKTIVRRLDEMQGILNWLILPLDLCGLGTKTNLFVHQYSFVLSMMERMDMFLNSPETNHLQGLLEEQSELQDTLGLPSVRSIIGEPKHS